MRTSRPGLARSSVTRTGLTPFTCAIVVFSRHQTGSQGRDVGPDPRSGGRRAQARGHVRGYRGALPLGRVVGEDRSDAGRRGARDGQVDGTLVGVRGTSAAEGQAAGRSLRGAGPCQEVGAHARCRGAFGNRGGLARRSWNTRHLPPSISRGARPWRRRRTIAGRTDLPLCAVHAQRRGDRSGARCGAISCE